MSIGIVGIKEGMTRLFTEDGPSVPVTVISAAPNRVTQVKRAEADGYNAIQVTFGAVKQSKVNKPSAGHFAKASVEAGKALKEFRLDAESELEVGAEISVTKFEAGAMVDVTSRSKGKGFQCVI